jgi:hypothetical protein
VGDEAMPWIAIKLHIRALGSRKDSGNPSTAAFEEITVFVDRANAIAHLKVLRYRHCSLLTLSMLWNTPEASNNSARELLQRRCV